MIMEKLRFEQCPVCRNEVEGIVGKIVQEILCKNCILQNSKPSNFEEIREDDLVRVEQYFETIKIKRENNGRRWKKIERKNLIVN